MDLELRTKYVEKHTKNRHMHQTLMAVERIGQHVRNQHHDLQNASKEETFTKIPGFTQLTLTA